jgi:hypothetical protein
VTTTNEISGDAQMSGLVVQARDVHGGLHHYAAPQPLPTPHQLPPVTPHFVGRTAEITALDAARRDGSSLVVITGLVGIGKTAFLTRWLSSATDAARPELYAELSGLAGPARPESVLRPWLRAFGIDRPPAGLQELSALWRSVTAAPPLLPAGSSSTIVVTNRRSLWEVAVDGAAHLPLRPLAPSGAIGLSSAGRLEKAPAWYDEARQAAQAEGDVRDEGQALLGIGACHHESGRPAQAEPYLTQAVALWKSCGYRRGVALATVLLGEISLVRGKPSEGLDRFTAAHSVLTGIDDSYDAARALALQGHARVLLGDLDAGVTDLETALEVFAAASSTRWQARTLEMLGRAYRARGSDSGARDCFRQAADLVEVIRPQEAERLRRLEGER